MALASRQVLNDVSLALKLLEEETDFSIWRIHWVAALALVRAVGHVLHKVDGKNEAYAQAVNVAYMRWKADKKKNEIFWQFINLERNNILKEYKFNLHPNEEVEVVVNLKLLNPRTGKIQDSPQIYPIQDNIYRPILDGFREGDDARDVLTDAIQWWDVELSEIENNCHK